MIAGVFLAAGRGERFGSNKLLHDVRGKPVVFYSLKSCVQSSLPRIYVVTDAGDRSVSPVVERHFPGNKKISIVQNASPERGMMSSLKLGIEAAGDADGVMVCLADMPQVTPGLINTILGAFEKGKIILPVLENRPRHPRILPREIFSDFLRLDDDKKGTEVLVRHEDKIVRLETGNSASYLDVDSLSDLEKLDPGLWA